jgi:hypothetical protein
MQRPRFKLIKKLKNIVEYSRRSSEFAQVLKDLEWDDLPCELVAENKSAELTKPRKLMQDVPTRWSSTHMMLKSVVDQKLRVRGALVATKSELILSGAEWALAESLLEALKPFAKSIKNLEGQKYPTLSMTPWVIFSLVRGLRGNAPLNWSNQPPAVQELRRSLQNSMNARWKEIPDPVFIAGMLDPRFKAFDYDEKTNDMLNQKLRDALVEESKSAPIDQYHSNNATPSSALDFTLAMLCRHRRMKSELDEFLDDVGCDAKGEPLDWWKLNEGKYKSLSKRAKKYLCIPASSGASPPLPSKQRRPGVKCCRVISKSLCSSNETLDEGYVDSGS